MLFNSLEFLFIFLPLTLALFYTVRRFHYEAALGVLALASVVFYSYWNPPFVLLLLASVGVNFVLGQKLSKWALLPKARQRKKVVLTFGVAANLAAIGYFKYANFFLENISAMTGQDYGVLDDIFLPLGISFFTFQQIAYLVDCYKGVTKEYKFTHYALFVTFFPQLIAGPIVHHKDMMPQFLNPEKGNKLLGSIALGITVFCIGLFKKVVIADYMATLATPVFSAAERGLPVTFFEGWAAALAYTFQLYYDFSGYSDMAIGLGLLFGVKIPVNFFSPYKATSIIDFWRMWHITLSKFLKDYVSKYKKPIEPSKEAILLKSMIFLKNKAKTLEDIFNNGQYIMEDEVNFNQDDIKLIDDKAKKVISEFSAKFSNVDKLSKETLEPIVNELIKSNDTNFKGVGQPLRIALTGSKFGPGIYDIIISLGKEEVTKRLTNKKLI